MKMLKTLLEMGEYEEEMDKEYVDTDEAKGHAKEFMDRASQVLNYNKKEGGDSEIEKLACQYAKDYYEEICDAIKGKRYEGRGEGEGEDMGGERGDDMDMEMDRERGDEEFM